MIRVWSYEKDRYQPTHPLADSTGWVLGTYYYNFIRCSRHPKADKNGWVSMADYEDNPPVDEKHTEVKEAPRLNLDTMDPLRHPCDHKYYDSKHKFREVTKAHGCIEYGNEEKHLTSPRKPNEVGMDKRSRREAIQRSIYELKNGRT